MAESTEACCYDHNHLYKYTYMHASYYPCCHTYCPEVILSSFTWWKSNFPSLKSTTLFPKKGRTKTRKSPIFTQLKVTNWNDILQGSI